MAVAADRNTVHHQQQHDQHHHQQFHLQQQSQVNSSAPGTQQQFFHEQRRGEVNDLKQLLRMLHGGSKADIPKQREAVRKVIAFMTLGIDVSRLFSEMALACGTQDIVQKKLVYLYLTTYAESKPDLCLLAVNTLLKDASDTDPAVRALALRSLCSLRSPAVQEYTEPQLRRGLVDSSGHVRRTAVAGVLKMWHSNPALEQSPATLHVLRGSDPAAVDALICAEPPAESAPLVEILFALLEDSDTHVVANVIYALNEILAAYGGLPVTRRLAAALLNRLKTFDERGQCAVLTLMSNYQPHTEDELWDFLNLLEERIRHLSSAVVLAAAKCFLHVAELNPALRVTILTRLRLPLLMALSYCTREGAYVLLQHVRSLVSESPLREAMGGDYLVFFFTPAEPSWIRTVKAEILAEIANENSVEAIAEELCAAVNTESDRDVARTVVNTLGLLARRFPHVCENVLQTLLSCVELDIGVVGPSALTAIQQVLRRFPSLAPAASSAVIQTLQNTETVTLADEGGTSAAIWILSRFLHQSDAATDGSYDAVYVLEDFVDRVVFRENASAEDDCVEDGENDAPDEEKSQDRLCRLPATLLLEVLNSAVILFLRQPLQGQPLLSKIFHKYLNSEALAFDVRDRALHALRLLKTLANEPSDALVREQLKNLVGAMQTPLENDGLLCEERMNGRNSTTFEGFNTLALIYGRDLPDGINFAGRFLPAADAMRFANGEEVAKNDDERVAEAEDVIAIYE